MGDKVEVKYGKIGICTHVFNHIDFDVYFNHLWLMYQWGRKFDAVFVGKSGLDAATARNGIIDRCYREGCTHALFIDGDHLIPQEALEYFMQSGNEAMVSGLVCKKGEDFQQVVWQIKKDENGNEEFFRLMLPMDGQVFEVDVCAFGCTLINLEKLKKLEKPYFRDTCDTPDPNGEMVNIRSDVNLCKAFRAIGEKVLVDTRVIIGHHGFTEVVYPQCADIFKRMVEVNHIAMAMPGNDVCKFYVRGDRYEP